MSAVRRRGGVTTSRRLAGDGVYWDRLRAGGRVCGATCAAPRKIADAARRVPVEPPPQASPPHATRLRALGRRHSLSTVAPRRRAAQHRSGSQPWLCLPVLAATRARAAAAARSMLESVHSRTAQNEIRVVLEVVLVVFACARLSDL